MFSVPVTGPGLDLRLEPPATLPVLKGAWGSEYRYHYQDICIYMYIYLYIYIYIYIGSIWGLFLESSPPLSLKHQ